MIHLKLFAGSAEKEIKKAIDMGERYFITGVQLGVIKAIFNLDKKVPAVIEEILEDIENEQFIGNESDIFTANNEIFQEKLRWRMIAKLSNICFKNWFGKEHSPDYKGNCKYCGIRC